MTIFGTRPEIIRLSLVTRLLDQYCEHTTVHTGQNYHESLSDIFIRDLEVRTPDIHLDIRSNSFGEQSGQILAKVDAVLTERQPDKVLILGDTNSALSAIVAARKGIPVFHMEAGNRCHDNRVPEELIVEYRPLQFDPASLYEPQPGKSGRRRYRTRSNLRDR